MEFQKNFKRIDSSCILDMSERELHNLGAAIVDERSPRIAFTLPCYDRQTPALGNIFGKLRFVFSNLTGLVIRKECIQRVCYENGTRK